MWCIRRDPALRFMWSRQPRISQTANFLFLRKTVARVAAVVRVEASAGGQFQSFNQTNSAAHSSHSQCTLNRPHSVGGDWGYSVASSRIQVSRRCPVC
jgi:hypothetical protein